MTVTTQKIIDAYNTIYNKSIKKNIVEAEDTKDDNETEDEDDGEGEEVKPDTTKSSKTTVDTSKNEADAKKTGRATKHGLYTDFTGKIRTGGVNGEVKDATFSIDPVGHVEFKRGIWLDGTWSDSFSYWYNGTWKDGVWKAGMWYGGVWENGRHEGGVFQGGVWKNGTWEYGVFDSDYISPKQKDLGKKPTTWEDGIWKSGDWNKNAVWIKGRDTKGNEHTDAPFNWGGMKYTKVTDPSKVAAKRASEPRYKEAFTKSADPRAMDTFDDEADKNLLAKAVADGAGRTGDLDESIKISECVKKHLKGTKILGSMIVEEEDYTSKQQEAIDKIKSMIVDEETDDAKLSNYIARGKEGPNDPVKDYDKNSNNNKTTTNEEDENIDEAKKKPSKEELKKMALNDEICMALEDASVEDLEAVKQFIDDGFKCLTDEEREELANAEHEETETPDEEAKERATGVEDEDKTK